MDGSFFADVDLAGARSKQWANFVQNWPPAMREQQR